MISLKINNKAQAAINQSPLIKTLVYLIFAALAVVGLYLIILSKFNDADHWSNYYAKEPTKIINLAEPGDKITLDVHKATEVAKANGQTSKSEIFRFNNAENEICVKLSPGKATCYTYFNDVDIINPQLLLAQGSQGKTNILTFEIADKLSKKTSEVIP
jgi:hypothetical protein